MEQNLSSQTLLEYTPIDISANREGVEAILTTIGNEPVELRGQAPLTFLLPFFVKLKDIAQEITYRPLPDGPAFLIFSTIDEEQYVRPYDVSLPQKWSNEEMENLENERLKDSAVECAYDLASHWQEARNRLPQSPLKSFLEVLYTIAPQKKAVTLKGICPVLPSLIALHWFCIGAESIFYQESQAAQKERIY